VVAKNLVQITSHLAQQVLTHQNTGANLYVKVSSETLAARPLLLIRHTQTLQALKNMLKENTRATAIAILAFTVAALQELTSAIHDVKLGITQTNFFAKSRSSSAKTPDRVAVPFNPPVL